MEQLMLVAPPMENDVYIEHLIYQPENTPQMKPWSVSIQGWSKGKMTVTIYHECFGKTGYARFPDIRLPTAAKFAGFVAKMVDVHITAFSKPYIELRPIDLIALREGYEKGAKNAKRYRIV